ncbi:MAG: glycoside hydrolase family 15 protein [Polyangia bacterium]
MAARIEDYALIGDCRSAALVSRSGSIDWLCLPRFDSAACFAALLGAPEHGRWLLTAAAPDPSGAPGEPDNRVQIRRRYRGDSLVLETEYVTDSGRCRVLDCMLLDAPAPTLVRRVEGLRGEVTMRQELIIRFDYGSIVPWVRRCDGELLAVGGPDSLRLRTPVPLHGQGLTTIGEFTIRAGESVDLLLCWHASHEPPPPWPADVTAAVAATQEQWQRWAERCQSPLQGAVREAVVRSLIVLKALTYAPTGGIVAAPTTSLPEWPGGVRNWDYRFCWLRDSTFTLYALLSAGYREEAERWRAWLVRALAGTPDQVNIMYGLAGERRLTETELPWLPGYEGSRPVRVGNAAYAQLQLDIFGEVMDTLQLARRSGLVQDQSAWCVQKKMLEHLGRVWDQPDEGIWEVRGGKRHFTHSKVMAWLAFDRSIDAVEESGLDGPVERWRALRDRIHADICEKAYSPERGCFTQSYGSTELDAALLMMGLVGFLPHDDPRLRRTVAAIEQDLLHDGLLLRYRTERVEDGLPPSEGVFLACSFWLVDSYALLGRDDEAQALFERLLTLRNDVGLLAEEYDPRARRQLGNFPQAFSHISLVNAAFNLHGSKGPAADRSRKSPSAP